MMNPKIDDPKETIHGLRLSSSAIRRFHSDLPELRFGTIVRGSCRRAFFF
jgi:hypothetical protein